MQRIWRALSAWAVVLLVPLVVGGCGGGSEAASVKSAKAALEKREYKKASVLLKEALERNPDSVDARLLLGTTLLEGGDLVAADLELRKARDLRAPASAWAPLLARTRLLQGQFKPLIDEFASMKLDDPRAQADLTVSVAAALAVTGQRDQANSLIESTLAVEPQHAATLMLKARILARPATLDRSIALVEEILQRNPADAEAWRLLGDLQRFGRQDAVKAQAAYEKVLENRPDDIQAHSGLVFIQLANKNMEAARKRLAAMEKALPAHPQTKFVAARVAFLGNDAIKARELVQQLLRIAPNNTALLEFAGAVELQLNSLVQAESYLAKAVSQAPDASSARLLLADANLRAGNHAKAMEVIRPNVERETPDAPSLSIAGEASLLLGDARRAEGYFQRASKLAPDESKYKTALALMLMSKGQADSAFLELRAISASAKDVVPDMVLISALMRRQQWKEALQAIDGLERKQPDRPVAANLRGNVQLRLRDVAGARTSFESAIKKDPVYLAAVAGLASIDLAEGKPKQAEGRYEAVLKADPRNSVAMVALAQLKAKNGASAQEIGKLLDQAVQANSSDVSARIALVHHWIGRRDIKSALVAAQAGAAAAPTNVDMLDALGSVQMLAGDGNQAISTFNKLAAMRPDLPKFQLRLADAYINQKDYAAAEKSFRRALDLAPTEINAQRGLIALSVREKRMERALEVARNIQKQRPTDGVGFLLEGDLHAEFKDYAAAVKAYREGLGRQVRDRIPERLYAVLTKFKGRAEADRFADEWLKSHPDDGQFVLFVGSRALAAEEYPLAERYFSDLVKLSPKSAEALNNLAWLRARQGKAGALPLIESALKLQPDNIALLDTLAYVLAAEAQNAKAVETCKTVVLRAPNEPVYRLSCSRIMLKAGLKAEAKAELDKLSALGTRFTGHAEVAELLKKTQ